MAIAACMCFSGGKAGKTITKGRTGCIGPKDCHCAIDGRNGTRPPAVSDALCDGRRLRALTVVDNYTRECLNHLKQGRDLPATIKIDNGSEFISSAMDRWAYERGVELDFSRPGRPIDNAKSLHDAQPQGMRAPPPEASLPLYELFSALRVTHFRFKTIGKKATATHAQPRQKSV